VSTREGFEAALLDCWHRRNFGDWLFHRAIYADWLEERNDPLYPMARAPCVMSPCTVKTNGGPRVWLWRLYFALPGLSAGASCWARNRRMNAGPLLGFPRATLRCMEVEGEQARFTLTFKERMVRKWVQQARGSFASAGEWRDAVFDINLHPAGFARLFWPARYPAEWDGPAVPTLFDGIRS
jgi:hypothetical protein